MESRQKQLENLLNKYQLVKTEESPIRQVNIGKGRFLIGQELEDMLKQAQIPHEPIVEHGIRFIRRTHDYGYHYFLTNLSSRKLDGWVPLNVKARSIVLFNPMCGTNGIAITRESQNEQTEVYLQLEPGESCIVRTFTNKQVNGPKWRYLRKTGQPLQLNGPWYIKFIKGGPKFPSDTTIDHLTSWTEFDDPEARRFSGSAKYKLIFDKPKEKADDWILDLGPVYESARIWVNQKEIGKVFSYPFQIAIGHALANGKNILEIEVTNLMANRIADMDRRGVMWRKFYNINFVNIQYEEFDASAWQPMESGLLGPVKLVPVLFESEKLLK